MRRACDIPLVNNWWVVWGRGCGWGEHGVVGDRVGRSGLLRRSEWIGLCRGSAVRLRQQQQLPMGFVLPAFAHRT